ncbi:MAG: lipoprotein signal peptidase [Marinilabiliaceae bacterium]|nr:lipoprotein signal peptidase [Marinilabiliaceae bacterium]
MSKILKSILIIVSLLCIDQILKIWIKTNMMLGEEYRVFDWFIIHFVENPGMAFGWKFGGKAGKLFLSIFRILAVFGIGWYLFKISKKEDTKIGLLICISLIFTGALGNIIDSTFYGLLFDTGTTYNPELGGYMGYSGISQFSTDGYASFMQGCVVDMFYFPIIKGRFPDWVPFGYGGNNFIFFRPVFNIADSAITIGIISLLIFQKKIFKEFEKK